MSMSTAAKRSLFENSGSFVYQRVDATIDNFFARDFPPLDSGIGAPVYISAVTRVDEGLRFSSYRYHPSEVFWP